MSTKQAPDKVIGDDVTLTPVISPVPQAEELLESFGENFLRDRFIANCPIDDQIFYAAKIERFTRNDFPRILVDASLLPPGEVTVDTVKADLDYLQETIGANPQAFVDLCALLDDPEAFRTAAIELGLTEDDARSRGGGLFGVVLIIVVALVVAGCTDDEPAPKKRFCHAPAPKDGIRCLRAPGHRGLHANNQIRRGRPWK